MTNINQFLPFYIGCEMLTYWGEQKEILTLKGVIGDVAIYGYDKDYNTILHSWDMSDPETKHPDKPILRPLESMTEEEASGCWSECGCRHSFNNSVCNYRYVLNSINNSESNVTPKAWFKVTKWLCEKGFDIWELHSQGLCLYRNDKGELY
jgi:hypothetical protein